MAMGKALYRKHRPISLSEVIGQEHVTDTLSRALKSGQISHAYLLTGPRGVGKTSIARILAYEANGLPYDEEGTHLDIIEIDAASNRRIDEIRELKERVNIAPTSAKYKVYIIDEVHMLTKEAFNALLKTLEEPPEHAIFILATTEAHKVPETIISRTQRFTFKPVDMPKVTAHLKDIAKKEKITIDDGALELIAAHGEGSFRDSISLLDQVRHIHNKVTLEHVQQAVGQAPEALLQSLLVAIQFGDMQAIGSALTALRTHGIQAGIVARQLSSMLRTGILEQSSTIPTGHALELLAQLLHVSAASDPAIALELAVYGSALGKSSETTVEKIEVALLTPNVETPKAAKKEKLKTPESVVTKEITVELPPEQPDQPTELNETTWQEVLASIKAQHNTLYGIARMAVPSFAPDTLTLKFAFGFHKKRLDDPKNKQRLLAIIYDVTRTNVTLESTLDNSSDVAPEPVQKPVGKSEENADLQTISNIFGGAEIVE